MPVPHSGTRRAMPALLLAGLLSTFPTAVILSAEVRGDPVVQIVTPTGATITADIADTTEKRARGLMFKESLPPNRGMLFTFAEAQPWTFWMKNTRIPLDIVWLDAKKRIVHVEKNVPGCSRQDDTCPQYQPNDDALYVLEVAGGQADALGLRRGAKLTFDLGPDSHAEPSPRPFRRR